MTGFILLLFRIQIEKERNTKQTQSKPKHKQTKKTFLMFVFFIYFQSGCESEEVAARAVSSVAKYPRMPTLSPACIRTK